MFRIHCCVLTAVLAALVYSTAFAAGSGWSAYGGDAGGTRYSTLKQVTPKNVQRLEVAWTFRTGDTGAGFPEGAWESKMTFETTPVLYDGALYFTTSETDVVAVDAATGKLRWRYDAHVKKLRYSDAASRGVAVWVDRRALAGAPCRARVYAPTLDGRLLALDAATGKLCKNFGEQGVVNLLRAVNFNESADSVWRDYLVTSPPAILGDKVIVGSSVGDNRAVEEELGIVRAFDARSGKLLWRWDPIPRGPDNPVYDEWKPTDTKVQGAANAWAPLSVDAKRHLVFVPTGSASPDFFGGERPGSNRWANSVVALDGDTGRLVWGRQLVHHDLWDYDVASQPTLAMLKHDGKPVPAVIQATKTGFLFTFNRETGEPIFPIVEKPVPQDAAPGETPARTQPFPVAPPALVRQSPVTPDDAWGLTFWDEGWCRDRIKKYRSEGIFTPPGLQTTIELPGYAGGVNWGGIAFDPAHQIAVVNTIDVPMLVTLIPRDQFKTEAESGNYDDWGFARMRGTPYAMRRKTFLSPFGIPCVKPPWGQLAAVDMVHGKILWQVPFGNAVLNHFNLGVPNIGGPIVTASGLIFIAATTDDDIRAFDIHTGKMLWQYHLPAGGQATPMTYEVNGRQYLVIAAGGHGPLGTERGDYVIAFALPK